MACLLCFDPPPLHCFITSLAVHSPAPKGSGRGGWWAEALFCPSLVMNCKARLGLLPTECFHLPFDAGLISIPEQSNDHQCYSMNQQLVTDPC